MFDYKYSQFIKDINKAKYILEKSDISAIIAISRGGLTLAHFLGERLDIRRVYSINSISYNGNEKLKEINIFGIPNLESEQTILIVDDIADSGRTLNKVINILQDRYPDREFLTFTIFYKESSIIKPNYFIYQAKDKWINFFWEIDFQNS